MFFYFSDWFSNHLLKAFLINNRKVRSSLGIRTLSPLFIEKNQYEFKYLARHYRKGRRRFLRIMTQYLMVFIENGAVRPLEHIELTAALIVELLSWWAMGIRYSSFETQDIPSDLAKSICMDNILAAYQISY